MKSLLVYALLSSFLVLSCQQQHTPNDELSTLRLAHESIREIVDLKLNESIWIDKQQGRNNEEIIAIINKLSTSRKALDLENTTSIQGHLSTLKSLIAKTNDPSQYEMSLARIDQYMTVSDNERSNEMLQIEISHLEFRLLKDWSAKMGIIDCCLPSLIDVQTNGEVAVGERYEMAVFPAGQRALWEHASYKYENIYLASKGSPVAVSLDMQRIGHVLIIQFDAPQQGDYALHFSVEEKGDYLAEPWRQDFEWPIEIN